MKIKQSILIILGIALLLMTVGTAAATTYTVNNSTGPIADFTSIQAAIDDVNTLNGDTILVYPGTYTENVNVYAKQLNITSTDGADNTTVQSSTGYVVLVNVATNATISGFTITGGDYGIFLGKVSNTNVTNNKVVGSNYVGIGLSRSYGNRLIGNIVEDTQYGIVLSESNSNTLINNKLEYNYNGIYFEVTNLGNLIYNNYFNNTFNVGGTTSDNIWNSTEEVTYVYEGNSYTNYTGNYYFDYANDMSNDIDGDGIGDTAYYVDNYPLMFWPVIPVPPIVDPSDALDELKDEISALDEKNLIKKLDGVISMLDKDEYEKAIAKLEDFIDTVEKLKDQGKLSEEQAEDLIKEAETIIKLIENSEG
ncbi:NosD domain-containing protein [Methanococcoides sp. FTZ1]|uniref:right-handed parallel beta-helix repeat-containing protein n=1 Tax=Methanococcoides sp. FTZ1 TaxID=3439061 RepID=UPI003F83C7FA